MEPKLFATFSRFSGHSDSLISVVPYSKCETKDGTLAFSNSEDHSIRLWDRRVAKSVRIFREKNPKSGVEISNLICSDATQQVIQAVDGEVESSAPNFRHQGRQAPPNGLCERGSIAAPDCGVGAVNQPIQNRFCGRRVVSTEETWVVVTLKI